MDPTEIEKGLSTTSMKVERVVETACPIVTYAFILEADPGVLADKSFNMLTPKRLVLG